jgi:hypothetical protein
MAQCSGTESPEMQPCRCTEPSLHRCEDYLMRKGLQDMELGQLHSHMQKNEVGPGFHTAYKNWLKVQNARRSTKLSETREYILWLWLGNHFFICTLKVQVAKQGVGKWSLSKIKNFCASEILSRKWGLKALSSNSRTVPPPPQNKALYYGQVQLLTSVIPAEKICKSYRWWGSSRQKEWRLRTDNKRQSN